MAALTLTIVALALVLGDGVEVLWWAAGALASVSAIRALAASWRERLTPEDPMDALGSIAVLMNRRTRRIGAEWTPSDRP